MIAEKDLSVLLSDLDCDGFGIRNCKLFFAANLVGTLDPRLSDQRAVLDGSVTNLSVADAAGIDQSKLNLNGNLPPSFVLDSTVSGDSDHGVRGDLYQPVAEKGAASGYASLDSGKHIPIGQVTVAGTGTLKELNVTTPSELPLVPLVTTGGVVTFTGGWASSPKTSWFGNPSGADSTRPRFNMGLPVTLIPSLDAAKIVSGVLPSQTMPPAIGVGATHAPGAVTDPGTQGDPTDYLGRDMNWHPMVSTFVYQPKLPSPTIRVLGAGQGDSDQLSIMIASSEKEAVCFYRVAPMVFFQQFTEPVPLSFNETIEAYAVKTGYNASLIAYFTNTFSLSSASTPPNS